MTVGEKSAAVNLTSLEDFNKIEHGEDWWNTGAWKEPEKTGAGYQEPELKFPANWRVQNPDCKHDHCSHTQLDCVECLEYSKVYRAEWLTRREQEKENANIFGGA